ncbi:kynureninase, putative [Leishmania panamensis]|uniref:Kynureninase n=1 Tax=Leishmania panamensis TaxID=5679 RepID=A0A088RTK1_LEIPA|nr:kynureninase, putative [Leishmania panamensis]AIN99333.1 kynureninase, putative [Leishmania panamensis]
MRNAAAETLLSTVSATGMALTEDGFAEHMDSVDPLREHRSSYHIPKMRDGTAFSYCAGNAMGLQHIHVEASVEVFLKKWREQAVGGPCMQPTPWPEIGQMCVKDMAAIVGAKDTEVAIMNTLTVNLHLLLTAFYRTQGSKRKLMIAPHSFPRDGYCLLSLLETRGLNPGEDVIKITAPGTRDWSDPATVIPTEAFLSVIEKRGDETAVLVVSAVQYLTGQWFDIPAIVKAARAKKIIVGVDCSHAVGNVPLHLHDWDVDFAYWCTCKYLNSGPGSLSGLFVHNKHASCTIPLECLNGLWGSDIKSCFSEHRRFEPAPGASPLQINTPSAACHVILAPSLKLMASVGMEAIRQKSLLLTAYLELLVSELIPPGCIDVVTPANPNQRGAQLSLRILPNKLKLCQEAVSEYECGAGGAAETDDTALLQRQLLDKGVIIDMCSPDMVSIAPAPMYNSFADVLRVVRTLASLF